MQAVLTVPLSDPPAAAGGADPATTVMSTKGQIGAGGTIVSTSRSSARGQTPRRYNGNSAHRSN